MLKFFAPYKKFGFFLLLLSALIIFLMYRALKPKRVLPIFDPYQVNLTLVDSSMHEIRKYHRIGNFKLLSHTGDTITQDFYKGKVYVADFFFTTCQTICPKMTQNMVKLQEALRDKKEVLLLSHTVMPQIDTLEQLQHYAIKKGVNANQWLLVTGTQKELYNLARKSYFVAKENPLKPYAMVHTENFTLVDQKGRIRGYYDGTSTQAMKQLLEDIQLLLEK